MDSSQLIVWLVVALVAVGIVVAVVLAVRRHRWITSLRERGWQFVDSPRLETVLHLVCPPFGQGFRRKVDDGVVGEAGAARVPFQVLEYTAGRFDDRVALLRLAHPLPELYLSSGQTRRQGVRATSHPHPTLSVATTDHAFADAALPALDAALGELGRLGPFDLAVDGHDLVALGMPKEADRLAPLLDALAAVASALGAAPLATFRQPDPERRFRFYGHPDWVFHGDDDAALRSVRHERGGFGHRAEDVLTGGTDGLSFVALRHHWKTQRTVTESDGKGGTRTRTVTDHHSEDICEVRLPAAWPLLSVGGGGWFRPGQKVHLESEQFNDALEVRSDDPRFASAVLHPRQMEYLLANRPPSFTVQGAVLRVSSHHDPEWLAGALTTVTGFLARVPGWVWKDLGVVEPAFSRPELG